MVSRHFIIFKQKIHINIILPKCNFAACCYQSRHVISCHFLFD